MNEEAKLVPTTAADRAASQTTEIPRHTLQSVQDLLATPTEGEDLRKSFFLPLEILDGQK